MARVVAGLAEKSVVVTNGIPVSKDIRVPVLTLRDVLYQSRIPVGGYFAPVAAYADKTAEAVLHFLETDGKAEIPYTMVSDTAFLFEPDGVDACWLALCCQESAGMR